MKLNMVTPNVFRSGWVCPGDHAAWGQLLERIAERRGLFYVRDKGKPLVRFIGRTRGFDLADTLRHHIPGRWSPGAWTAMPTYKARKVEVMIEWCPGVGHAEARWRKQILNRRPADVSGLDLAEASRIESRVVVRREKLEHHRPVAMNRACKPAVASVAAGDTSVPDGLPAVLDRLTGRLVQDVTEATPPGAIVAVEHMRHGDGESVWRLGRLRENDDVSDVFMFDTLKPLRVSRRCLSVLLMGGVL